MEEAPRKHRLIISAYKARDMSMCMCEKDQTGAWKTFSQWELHSTKSMGSYCSLKDTEIHT